MSRKLIDLAGLVLMLSVAAGLAHADLLEGLVGYWPLDEGAGDTTADASGAGHNGTFNNGTPQWVLGQYGNALEFDGNNKVEIPDHEDFHLVDAVTVALWGQPDEADQPGFAKFFTKQKGSTEYPYGLQYNGDGNQIRATINASARVDSPGIPNVGGEWAHFCFTYDGSVLILYKNGEEVVQRAATGALQQNDLGLSIGGRLDSGQNLRGIVDDVLLYNRALAPEEVLLVMEGIADRSIASNPGPAPGDADVSRDVTLGWTPGEFASTHNVYFGISLGDVNDASVADSLGVLAGQGLGDSSFEPGRLAFGQTYFWRVDEVNAAPDFTVYSGGIWNFTVEPFSIPITGITATASSSFGESGPERTIDGSGLADDLHGTSVDDMWLSTSVPATIEYAFDRAYKLHELWIWNSNQLIESFVGFGGKDVVIEHSLDGENWTLLDGVGPLARAPGAKGYAHNNTIDLGGATAQHVRVTINSVQGFAPQASLSEVRFFYIPVNATRPNPETGATDVAPDVTLSWGRDGREAASHDVYVGTDADNLSLAGSVSESSFETLSLDLQLDQTYSWRVDEVNDTMDPSTWTGDIWRFTTADAIVIDDMESYKDEEFLEIWATWIDGFEDPANGSLVGADPAIGDFAPETGIVHAGTQSLPLHFDNSSAQVSEATRTFDQTQDWTRSGIRTLVLYFKRGADNVGSGQVYVKINDTKMLYEAAAGLPPGWDVWTQWTIDLSAVADAASVRSLTIGVEGAGAQGVIYVDSIQLYKNAPAASEPLSWFEAESGAITAPMQVFSDSPTASAGQHIGTVDGIGDENGNPPADGLATYSITVPEDGVYRLAFRVLITGGSNSFWVRIPGMVTNTVNHASGWVRFNEMPDGDTWHWEHVYSDDDNQVVVEFTLSAGTHTLEIARREDGTLLDAIAVLK
ncbi:MAG: hypothetical protein IIC50_22645 [Planctomycetes bacterium]|nr:hypothetical protein [Planctomycetota bacterium]